MRHLPFQQPRLLTGPGFGSFSPGCCSWLPATAPRRPSASSRWPTPLPFLAWPWLYLVLLTLGVACLVCRRRRQVVATTPPLRFIVTPLAALLAAFLLSTCRSQVHSLSALAFLAVLGIVCACWLIRCGPRGRARQPRGLARDCDRACSCWRCGSSCGGATKG